MEKILTSNKKCYYFQKFLKSHDCSLHYIHFYLDANEFYNMFSSIRKEEKKNTNEEEDLAMLEKEKLLSKDFFLTQASKIYDKYIRKGALQQVIEEPEVGKTIVDKLGRWDGEGQYPYDVFNLASDMTLTKLTDNYLEYFLESDEYIEYENEASNEVERKDSIEGFKLLNTVSDKPVHTITGINNY